jgi:hypothetical protein
LVAVIPSVEVPVGRPEHVNRALLPDSALQVTPVGPVTVTTASANAALRVTVRLALAGAPSQPVAANGAGAVRA